MFGFKAVKNDYTAHNNFKYTIGETYTLSTKPTLCNNGFHFCKIPLLVFEFYHNPDDRYLLVEATGTIVSDDIKYCTNQLKIVKEIDREIFISESFHFYFLQEHSNLITNDNYILLKLGAEKGYFEIVKYLIETHCDPHVNSEEPLQWAVINGHFEIVKYLIEVCNCDTHVNEELPLQWAAEYGHLEVVKYLIEKHNCDPHVNSEYALRWAAKNGHLKVLKYLIEECKCDPHVKSEEALRCAAYYEHFEVLRYLIETHHCDPHVESEEALLWAAEYGHLNTIVTLM